MKRFSVLLACVILMSGHTLKAQNLEYVGSALWSRNNDIEVVDSLAYCVYANGLLVLNVADPTHQAVVSQTFIPGKTQKLDISGNYAFLADSLTGLWILDISNPMAPIVAGRFDTSASFSDIFIAGNKAYLTDTLGFTIVDISSISAPVFNGHYSVASRFRISALAVSGNYAYIASIRGRYPSSIYPGPLESGEESSFIEAVNTEGDNPFEHGQSWGSSASCEPTG